MRSASFDAHLVVYCLVFELSIDVLHLIFSWDAIGQRDYMISNKHFNALRHFSIRLRIATAFGVRCSKWRERRPRAATIKMGKKEKKKQ